MEVYLEFIDDSEGAKIFYDIAFRKDTQYNILGLFAVGDEASPYIDLGSDEAIICCCP